MSGPSCVLHQLTKYVISAYEVHPGEWSKIADVVDRTEQDVRDRYKYELVHRSTRRIGIYREMSQTAIADPQSYRTLDERRGGASD